MFNRISISFLLVLLAVTAADADSGGKKPSSSQASPSCQELLSAAESVGPLDYAMSDFEGLFFSYLEKIQAGEELPKDRIGYYMKDILSLKASVLNRAGALLPMVAYSSISEEKRARMLFSIFSVVDSLGIPAAAYGFRKDEQGNISLPIPARKTVQVNSVEEIAPKREPIGFVPVQEPHSDLATPLKRSIGFARHEIRVDEPPKRTIGNIGRRLTGEQNSILMILDGETGQTYAFLLQQLFIGGGESDGKKYVLRFVPEAQEWVVAIENLNNPSGRIGFL